MPKNATIERAKRKAREGKSPSTQAGEFVREEIHHIREGKHGARSAKQAIAIGLSKARQAGVKLPPRAGSKAAPSRSRPPKKRKSATRARAVLSALKHESHAKASHAAISRQAHKSAVKRGPARRHQAALKDVRTKGAAGLREAGKKAARTRRKAA